MKIIPTVFSKNKTEFVKRLELLTQHSREVQIDIMDGKFVRSKSIDVKNIPNLRKYHRIFEAHLMVKNPERYIPELQHKFIGRVIFHYESVKNECEARDLIKIIRSQGMVPIIAINPKTKASDLKRILPELHHIQLMGVNPGKENQKLVSTTYTKIKSIRKINPNIVIQIDGGVNKDTAKKLKKAGANILNSGSYIYKSKDPEIAIKELKNA